MKWVKVAIGAVIAIAVVPMIALAVFNLTKETTKEEVVTFEVLTETTVTSGTFDLIDQYVILLNNETSTNVISISYNDVEYELSGYPIMFQDDEYFNIMILMDGEPDGVSIYNTDTFNSLELDWLSTQVGDTFEITFEVTQAPILSGVTATLLLLAPVIFVSGVLYFIYNNKEEGI